MAVKKYKYKLDNGLVAFCRMDEAIKAAIAGNTEPTDEKDLDFTVNNSGSRRQNGVAPRYVAASRSFGTAPDNGTKNMRIAILDPAKVTGATPAIAKNQTFTYQGNTWTIEDIYAEKQN